MRRLLILIAPVLLGVAACDRPQEGTSVSIIGEGGNVVGGIDGETGELKVDVPGFEGSLKLPKLKLDASNVDLNGVKLYPGSTVDGIDIAGGEGDGLRLRFSSPAAAATVRDWLGQRLGEAGFTLRAQENMLTGATDEGQPFRLEMRPDGAGASKGVIVIG